MARVSRFSKKQPAFDPSELKDLIFSPAVGTGVGSHLLQAIEDFPATTEEQVKSSPKTTTVDMLKSPTVDSFDSNQTTSLGSAPSIPENLPLVTKVIGDVASDMSTVAIRNTPTVDILATVSGGSLEPWPLNKTTEIIIDRPTVDIIVLPTVVGSEIFSAGTESAPASRSSPDRTNDELALRDVAEQGREEVSADVGSVALSEMSIVSPSEIQPERPPKDMVLWITEQGDLVPQGRVKRIRLAQDVINSAEESVYDTLWTTKSQTDEREPSRVVQAGYDYLVRRTRLSKKTIQRIVAKLIDKDFIAIERPADIYQRTSTVYRVFGYKTVLDRHLQRGRSHVAKMGPGFSYVRPMQDPRLSALNSSARPGSIGSARQADLSIVAVSSTPTVVKNLLSTPAKRTIDTVAELDASTVVRQTITSIGKDILGNNTSSSSGIYQVLSQFGAVDDDIVDRLIRNCKQQAPNCTEEEIIHFIEEKGSLVRVRDSRIYSPIGFLLTAVPKCLTGEAFRFYREEQIKRREAEAAYEAKRQAELDEWRREQEARLADPNVSEQDRQFIRKCLGVQ